MSFDKLLKENEVRSRLGISKSTLWAWTKIGKLPQPVRLSRRCTRWRESDIAALVRPQQEQGAV